MARAHIRGASFVPALLGLLLLGQPLALAHEHEEQAANQGEANQAEKLGEVSFPVSCDPAVQQRFDRAVAVLHSFWYEEAAGAFAAVAEADPGCAMAQWGVAMSLWYPLWYPPSEAALKAGADAVAKAQALGAGTDRERDYIAAIAAFYRDWDKLDHRTRSIAYERAMGQVHQRYPDDREADVFYALALLATASPTDKTYANQLKAAALLEPVFAEQPDHPGVAHYLIHSYDAPPLAERGLAAAHVYAGIAPSAPHALHMPSHIFTRLGLWQEAIASNVASADAGRAYALRTLGEGVVWDQTLHAMDYLAYAYLQTGQDQAARRVRDELLSYRKASPETLAAAYTFAAIPARFALERRAWAEAAALQPPPAVLAWDRFPGAGAMVAFTRALGAARTGDVALAGREVQELRSLEDVLVAAGNKYWADQVEVQRQAASAALARAEGRDEEALRLMRSAADLEGSMDKHPVTPSPVVPARELLGELLLELGRPEEALAEFERSLGTDPNRFRSLYGAARAAERMGDAAKAHGYYERVVALCGQADTERPELVEARAFVARQG